MKVSRLRLAETDQKLSRLRLSRESRWSLPYLVWWKVYWLVYYWKWPLNGDIQSQRKFSFNSLIIFYDSTNHQPSQPNPNPQIIIFQLTGHESIILEWLKQEMELVFPSLKCEFLLFKDSKTSFWKSIWNCLFLLFWPLLFCYLKLPKSFCCRNQIRQQK